MRIFSPVFPCLSLYVDNFTLLIYIAAIKMWFFEQPLPQNSPLLGIVSCEASFLLPTPNQQKNRKPRQQLLILKFIYFNRLVEQFLEVQVNLFFQEKMFMTVAMALFIFTKFWPFLVKIERMKLQFVNFKYLQCNAKVRPSSEIYNCLFSSNMLHLLIIISEAGRG